MHYFVMLLPQGYYKDIIAKQTQSFYLPLLGAALTLVISIFLLLIGELKCKHVRAKRTSIDTNTP